MSVVVDFISEAGPFAIGAGGLYVAYVAGIKPGRESRHHARVELLYHEMLDALLYERNSLFSMLGPSTHTDPSVAVESQLNAFLARVELFASRRVQAAWSRARQPLDEMRLYLLAGQADNMTAVGGLLSRHEEGREFLVRVMRDDLGVPRADREARTWFRPWRRRD